MAYTPYYAPYARPMGYYNPSIPQDMQTNQQMPVQQPIQQMPMQTPTPFMQSQSSGDTMLWVLNENEASSFPVAPNNSVVLWDKNNKTFYIKTANAQGIPSMQIYDFTERIENAQNSPTEHKCTCGDKFATKEQLNALIVKYDELKGMYDELINSQDEEIIEKPTSKAKNTTKKTKEND
ncbi:MAG: hypothetical protein IKY67_05735 [Paludibacteraceae bacterium]|nr:hypothetical protein [Paludibacteraceae bacterium]